MAGVRLLDAVDREGPDGVDRESIEAGRGEGHSLSPVARPAASGGVVAAARRLSVPIETRARTPAAMPSPARDARRGEHRIAPRPRPAPVVVVGDIVVDVILAPERASSAAATSEAGSCARGRVRGDGRAWLGRLGAPFDARLRRRPRWPGSRAGLRGDRRRRDGQGGAHGRRADRRIGVLVDADGQRSFVQDRGAALARARGPHGGLVRGADAVHLPAYSLLDEPLGRAGMASIRLAREAGALMTVDLASTAPLLALGRRAGSR